MKRLLALAAFLLASSAANAQYTFQYGGHTIRIDPDRGTVSIPGIYDNTPHKKRTRNTDQETATRKQAPQDAKAEPQTPAAPAPVDAAGGAAPQPVAPAAQAPVTPAPAATAVPATTTATNTPEETPAVSPAQAPSAGPAPVVEDAAPKSALAPAVTALPAPQPAPAPSPQQQAAVSATQPAAAAREANSPVGVWLTEENEGKVRIEQCGTNLCGYSVDAKSNQNGEQVLINMKPGKDLKWTGRILDPNTGSTYDSTIALKGPGMLRVQGCAFGGMFCGDQIWTRVD